jgi:hypothetical protein
MTSKAVCSRLHAIRLFENPERIEITVNELLDLGVCTNRRMFSDDLLGRMAKM